MQKYIIVYISSLLLFEYSWASLNQESMPFRHDPRNQSSQLSQSQHSSGSSGIIFFVVSGVSPSDYYNGQKRSTDSPVGSKPKDVKRKVEFDSKPTVKNLNYLTPFFGEMD